MATLQNTKWELFAQEVAKGKSATEAYGAAGYETNAKSAGVSASRLLKNASIRARIENIMAREQFIEAKATEKAIEKLALTKERVLSELMSIGFANIADYVDLTGDSPSWALKDVPREQMAAVAELTTETVFERTKANGAPSEVRKVKLKFWDKKGSLVDLGKHLGLFRERVDLDVNATVEHTADDSFANLVNAMEVVRREKAGGPVIEGEVDTNSETGPTPA